MRFLLILSSMLFFTISASAQSSTENSDLTLTLKDPYISVSAGVSPHYSSFNFDMLQIYNYGIQTSYGSMKYAPLTNLKLTAGVSRMSISYQLTTTFPLEPTFDIYRQNGTLFNRNVYQEWTQILTFKATVYKNLAIGVGYHHRTIRFGRNTLSPTSNFLFELQNQQNLFLTAENLFVVNELLIKPSFSYSIREWVGSGYNYFYRSPGEDPKNYEVAINSRTNYWGMGITIGHRAILKNLRLNFRYESYENGMILNNRYLFGIAYKLNVLKLL